MRVLIPFIGSIGHFHPFVPLARALENAGHEVAFACPQQTFGHVVEANDFRSFPAGFEWRQPNGRTWQDIEMEMIAEDTGERLVGPARAAWVQEHFFAGKLAETMIPDLLGIHRDWPYDLVLRDAADVAGVLVAEKLEIPYATAGYANLEPPANFQRFFARPVARHRERLGLPPDPELQVFWRYLVLAPIIPSLIGPDDYVSPVTHFIRPESFDQSGDETLPDWVAELPDQPTIYATLGTVASRFPGSPEIFAAIVDAFRDESVNLILTVGRTQDPAQYDPGLPHIHVEGYIPQSLLLSRCDLVITHGGYNTMLSALGHGLPVVTIPIAADQFQNAARAEHAGAGLTIAPDRRTSDSIREAVRRALTDRHYQDRAAAIRTEIEAMPGQEHAVLLLERLGATGRPQIANH